jgi:EamA domain-containing membrane protein RarD
VTGVQTCALPISDILILVYLESKLLFLGSLQVFDPCFDHKLYKYVCIQWILVLCCDDEVIFFRHCDLNVCILEVRDSDCSTVM